MSYTYDRLTEACFLEHSLDGFIRRQEVNACWRSTDAGWTLIPCAFTEDWDLRKRRAVAREILALLKGGGFAFGAWEAGQLVGFAAVSGARLGSSGQYAPLELFHVPAPCRGQGVGRTLFGLVCGEARRRGAERLYISAHASAESQAAYRRLGCIDAQEPDPARVAAEPFDVQMEYRL